jgi:hypothetical protein
MKYTAIREEELKNKVGGDWFSAFDTTEIIGNIDFCVLPKQDSLFGRTALLWAEAKTGDYDLAAMFVQLILTIGKARTFDKTLPPAFLGAFDFKKIAFVPYISVQDIFYLNDFDWTVTSSNRSTKEFAFVKARIKDILKSDTHLYDFEKDENDLNFFIKNNIAKATEAGKIKIDKNNFIPIYLRWLDFVKPAIDVNWDELREASILDSDFYLADLFVDDKDTQRIEDDTTIRDNLFVIYENQGYKIAKENIRQMFDATISIRNKETYRQFWKRYKRPPLAEFQDYIIERRDLLVPQDIRERKGAFFTPRKWVELSQKYLADVLGEDWQDEYYVWDCAAGTGNLLAGLTNKYNIWASTLDQADVNAMHDRIDHGANLLKNHVVKFDFLNDDFSKLPQGLQEIINDENKRKKLVIYINPPYAEAGTGLGKEHKTGVAITHKTRDRYSEKLGKGTNELFAQFLARIYFEIPSCPIAVFSKLKNLQSSNFQVFRQNFLAKLEQLFLAPANTFDNVKGVFPIGFSIWNTQVQEQFAFISADIYDKSASFIGTKSIYSYDDIKRGKINDWLRTYHDKHGPAIGIMHNNKTDFQHNTQVVITSDDNKDHTAPITGNNLIQMGIYLAVRKCIPSTWLNDRDQFLYPNDNWKSDLEFQNDCLAFTLFTNEIRSTKGTNHWIPFTESEVNASDKFESSFMTDFMNGRIMPDNHINVSLFESDANSNAYDNKPRNFSAEATAVFYAGRELWKYYHLQKDINVNASLYEIREYFQGRNDEGRMNARGTDAHYTELIANLREKLNLLAGKIAPKVYEHGFLKK